MSDSDTNTTPPKKGRIKSKKVRQKFRSAWLSVPEFKYWLQPVADNPYKARCKYCNTFLRADISVIKTHLRRNKHKEIGSSECATSGKAMKNYLQYNISPEESQLIKETKKAEINLCGWLVEHNISFQVIDHLQGIAKKIFPDSKIAKNLTLKRTKATAIVKNIIGEAEKTQLQHQLQNTKFSILTDESTDISTTATSCIAVRYFDEKTGTITSKFWELEQVLKPH